MTTTLGPPDLAPAGPGPDERERPAGRLPVSTRPARGRPARERLALGGVTVVAFVLGAWNLSANGLGNQYYAAATRSMTTSWGNFFFVSFDPGGFISVDKPPVALWVWAASARVFGVSSWSLLLPGVLAGAASVALLWCIVRRLFGVLAATVAALALAVSPVNVAVDRLNLPEPFLVLALVAAAWAVLRSFESERPLRWLALAGVFVGVAFNVKMLAAFIPVPALGLAVLLGTAGWWPRLRAAAAFGLSALAASVPWILVVDLVPASSRPFVGGSTDNTVRDLVFGYNGFGRVSGGSVGGGGGPPGGVGGPAGGMTAAGGIFGGSPGAGRLFGDALAGQIAWLLPLAIAGALVALWLHRRDRARRAAVVLWAGWLALYAVVFSMASGTFHAYYTSVMMPAVAALVGIGAASVITLARRRRAWLVVLGAVVAGTVGLQLVIAGRVPSFYGWTRGVLIVGVALGVAGVAAGLIGRRSRVIMAALAVGFAGLLALPTAWAASETANPVLNATLPQAGPRTGAAGSSFGSVSSNGDPALAAFLLANRGGETWDVVVSSAQVGSGLLADQDVSVMALGGFMGTDRSITLAAFADLVADGRVRFVDTGGSGPGVGVGRVGSSSRAAGPASGPGGGGPGAGPGGGASSAIFGAVTQVCPLASSTTTVGSVPASVSGTLHDCAGQGAALRALAS